MSEHAPLVRDLLPGGDASDRPAARATYVATLGLFERTSPTDADDVNDVDDESHDRDVADAAMPGETEV